MQLKYAALGLAGLSSVPVTYAWGAAGHEIVATIAQIYLHPSAIIKLCDVLPSYADCHLAPVAAWADKVRNFNRWSASMHYVGGVGDHPSQTCIFGETEWENNQANVLSAIRNTTYWIKDGRDGTEEALKFLVHFVGDMHQPLHLTGRERGGNGMKVRFDGRITNLHSVWDSRLIAKSLRTIPRNYTRPIPVRQVEAVLRETIYDPYIRQIMWEGVLDIWQDELEDWLLCPGSSSSPSSSPQQVMGKDSSRRIPTDDEIVCPQAWGQPMHKLNCDIIWPPELDAYAPRPQYVELDTPEYADRIKNERIVEKLLASGGLRLAGILNYLFADEEELLRSPFAVVKQF